MVATRGFGKMLQEQRVSQGLSRESVSRRLRIRPDIIRAIENEDFSIMPPTGYSKSMIAAYGHLLHMQEDVLMQSYNELLREYEAGHKPQEYRSRRTSSSGSSSMAQQQRYTNSRASNFGINNLAPQIKRGRSHKDDYNRSIYSDSQSKGIIDSARMALGRDNHKSNWSNSMTQSYQNMNNPNASKNKFPYILIAIILILLLIILSQCAFNSKEKPEAKPVESTPITGLTDPGDTSAETPVEPIKIAPTAAVFSYEVHDGSDVYMEIYIDGSSSPSLAQTVSGPSYKSYDVTGTLSFVCTNPSGVTVLLDGEEITLTDDNSDGVYVYDVDFNEILTKWKEANE